MPIEVDTNQLLQIIGTKQVEIEILRVQLKALSEAYEQQRQALAAQAPDEEGA